MYIAFASVLGTVGAVRGVRGELEGASDDNEGVFPCACEATLPTASGVGVAVGGGNGDIEMLETDAECA